jgi:hypothetical protein
MSSTIILIGQYWGLGQRDFVRKSNFGDRERKRERERKKKESQKVIMFFQKK